MRLSVLDPSSMILQVIGPSFKTSPDVAETKLIGRLGIFIVASACRASSSMLIGCFAGRFVLASELNGEREVGRLEKMRKTQK